MSLKTKVKKVVSRVFFENTASTEFYIADYKNFNNGNVELQTEKPKEVSSVWVKNSANVNIEFCGLLDNALFAKGGKQYEQCECILTPYSFSLSNFILFIEIKNTDTIEKALRHYPDKMLNQIIETVEFFRENEIIDRNKRVHAVVSFPDLLENFSAQFFPKDETAMTYILSHKIQFLPTNSFSIISNKRIHV